MKRITLIMSFIFMCFICFNVVFATTYSNSELSVDIPDEYIDLKNGMDNYLDLFKNYDIDSTALKEYFNKHSIIMGYISKDFDKEILVTTISNSTTKSINNISNLDSDEYLKLKNTLKESSINDNVELVNEEDYITNDIKYIHLTLNTDDLKNNKITTSHKFYTVINNKAYTISLNSINSEFDKDEIQSIISSITFDKEKNTLFSNNSYYIYLIFIIISYGIGCVVTYVMRHFDRKKRLNLTEKIETTQNKFGKFGGLQFVFIILVLFNVIFTTINLFDAIMTGTNTLISNQLWKYVYAITLGIQSIIQIFIFAYLFIISFKKDKKTTRNILITLSTLLIITILLVLIRLLTAYFLFGLDTNNNSYYINELCYLASIIILTTTWIIYFKKSDRVKIYYNYYTKNTKY